MQKTRAKRTKTPKHSTVARAYAFPLEVTETQAEKLFNVKNLCWEAREFLVAERARNRRENQLRRAAGETVKYLTQADQYVQVALFARDDRRFAAVHSQVLQNIAVRVDEGTRPGSKRGAKVAKTSIRPARFSGRTITALPTRNMAFPRG